VGMPATPKLAPQFDPIFWGQNILSKCERFDIEMIQVKSPVKFLGSTTSSGKVVRVNV